MGIFRMYTGVEGKSVIEDLRLWGDVTGEGHRTRFPVPSVSISMPLPD
jgi:hypothetical protein